MVEVHHHFADAPHPELFDIEGDFARITGISIETYLGHVFAIWAYIDAHTPALLAGDLQAIVNHPETSLRNTGVDIAEFKATLRQLSRTPAQAREQLMNARATPPYFDFVLFQDYPLIEFPDGFFWPLDPGFLIDKFGEGIFWLLHRPIPGFSAEQTRDRNLHFRQWWGRLFEEYVHRLMEFFYPVVSGRYLRIPEDPRAMTRCDAMLDSRPSVALLEYKASYLRTDAKLSGSDEVLEEIRRKVAAGGEAGESAKGVRQLAASCTHLQRTGEIAGLGPFPNVERIYPVLVTLDNAFSALGLSWYLDTLFRQALPADVNRDRVAPLTVMTSEDLENVLPYTREQSFTDLLRTYHAEDAELRTSFRFVMQKRVRREDGPRNEYVDGRAHAWEQALLERYFPRQGDAAIT
jgi:hypothetical protein